MDVKTIAFNKSGYDPFIDFLKVYSIICVIIAHILPSEFYKYILFQVWGNMQVPMFVLIQVFHAYKKGIQPKLNWNSLLKRICLPFITVQAIVVGFKALTGGGHFMGRLYFKRRIWPWLLLHLDLYSDCFSSSSNMAVA